MAPTIKKKKPSKKAVQINPKSAEYADKREYRRGFKANKKYARRHGAFMFVSRGPFDWTKLHFAVWKDDLNAVKSYVEYHQTTKPEVLLKKGQWGETALQLALRLERSPEMIRELLRGKGMEAIHFNLEEYYFKDIDDQDLWYGYCYYPIHEAASYMNHQDAYEIVKMLADGGADLEEEDESFSRQPLEMAADRGHFQVVKFLEGKGAQVSDKKLLHELLSRNKMDAERTDLLQYLVDRNPEYLASKEDKMFKWCAEGDFSNLEAFIKVGANVHGKNSEGKSLLEVLGTKPSSENRNAKQWPSRLKKMKTVLEKAMKKKTKK